MQVETPQQQEEGPMRKAVHALIILALGAGLPVQTALSDAPAEEVVIAVAPQTMLLSSIQSGEVTVHVEIAHSRVDCATITMNGVPVMWTKADSRGELVAKFDEEMVKGVVEVPSTVLTLKGLTVEGEPFEGSDEVRVVP